MPKLCSLINCKNRISKEKPLITLTNNACHKLKWKKFIENENGSFQENKIYHLCHDHFHSTDIKHNGHRYQLSLNAYPKIGCSGLVHDYQITFSESLCKFSSLYFKRFMKIFKKIKKFLFKKTFKNFYSLLRDKELKSWILKRFRLIKTLLKV
jgi:hypothetical protein